MTGDAVNDRLNKVEGEVGEMKVCLAKVGMAIESLEKTTDRIAGALEKMALLEEKHNQNSMGVQNAHQRIDAVEEKLRVGEPYLKVLQWATEQVGKFVIGVFLIALFVAIGWWEK